MLMMAMFEHPHGMGTFLRGVCLLCTGHHSILGEKTDEDGG